jgi:hypothetical protein
MDHSPEHLNTQHSPPPPGPRHPLIRVTDGDCQQIFTILADRVFGIWTHWTGRTSMPCLNHGVDCLGCKSELPKRWKGYLHCWDHTTKQEGFVELTPVAAAAVIEQAGREDNLRSLRLQLRRTKGGAHGRLNVQVLPAIGNAANLPPEKTPVNTLQLLWGVSQKRGEYQGRR